MLLVGDLRRDQVAHTVWIEEPEKIATCVALKPYPEQKVPDYVKKLLFINHDIENVKISNQ